MDERRSATDTETRIAIALEQILRNLEALRRDQAAHHVALIAALKFFAR